MPDADLEQEKKRLRKEALARRAEASATFGPLAADMVATQFVRHVPLAEAAAVIAGYWPMRDEIGTVPLMRQLHQGGHAVALPVVVGKDHPLVFRLWQPDLALEPGPLGTSHPPASMAEANPTVVMVPLLAFDSSGHRLGYGGGHYDRTLARLRALGPVIAVGLAYESQRVDSLPAQESDQRLDWVVTQNAAHRFA